MYRGRGAPCQYYSSYITSCFICWLNGLFFFITELVPRMPKELSGKLQPSPEEKQTSPTSKKTPPSQIEICYLKINNHEQQIMQQRRYSKQWAPCWHRKWGLAWQDGKTELPLSPTNLNHLLHIFFTLLQGKCFIDKASPGLVITLPGLSEIWSWSAWHHV